MWHSMASSFSTVKELAILDTHHESLVRYNCVNHEEVILSEILKLELPTNILIHVHMKIKLYEMSGIDYVIFGNRNLFAWRSSMIGHLYLKQAHNWGGSSPIAKKTCTYRLPCKNKKVPYFYFWLLFRAMLDSNWNWIQCVMPENQILKYEISSYSMKKDTQFEIGNAVKELICTANETVEFNLQRFGSSDLNIKGAHDTRGMKRPLSHLLNIITWPIFYIFLRVKK